MQKINKYRLLCLLFLFCLSGCAFRKQPDPFEGLNRGIFHINKALDCVVLKPVAKIYQTILPKFVQCGVNNFFQNLNEIPTIANDILQADFAHFKNDSSRFILNTTWGIGGLFDMAGGCGRARHYNDFGQTLGKWGYRDSIYIVLPFFGPSTVRDAIGRAVNYGFSVWPYIRPQGLSWGLYGLFAVDARAYYLKLEPALEEVSFDEYVFMRDAYLQRRATEIAGCNLITDTAILEGPPE